MEDSNKVLFDILNERLELLRQLDAEGDSERRRHIAKETQTLHAPMAHRLGLYQIKTEMEDLALKFLDYDMYKHIAHELNAKKAEREAYIASFIAPLEEKLKKEGFVFTIKGRPKSIHSIYHKMQVLGPEKRWVEVQIRTKRMDEVAEKGVAAHWSYKGVKGSIVQKSGDVFVFTPTGDLRRLPEGATVLDFAYSIHSEVGAHCVGGTIRNQNVSIRQKLENGDQVSILTSPNQHPNADWLNFVASTKAKNKIRQALKEIEYKQAAEGKEIIDRKFRNWKINYTEGDITKMAIKLGYKAVSDMYQAVATGKEMIQRLRDVLQEPEEAPTQREHTEYVDKSDLKGLAIEVDMNVKNVDYNLSKCCNPQPGDPIFAFVSVLKGIRIHRCDCPNAGRRNHERVSEHIVGAGGEPDEFASGRGTQNGLAACAASVAAVGRAGRGFCGSVHAAEERSGVLPRMP